MSFHYMFTMKHKRNINGNTTFIQLPSIKLLLDAELASSAALTKY